MQNFNYHTHTYRCKHSQPDFTDEEYVIEHINKCFTKMAFTDHCPEKEVIDVRPRMRMDYSQKDEYLSSIKALKEKYKDKINIKTGFEVEYLPGQEKNLFELKNEVDIIILGQHFVYDEKQEGLVIFRHDVFSDEELYRYADYVEEACKLGLPDYIAHPDIFMLNRTFGKTEEEISRKVCETAQKYNIPIEINLGQCRFYKIGKIDRISYPCKEFWKIASEYNVKVLYGLDAHWKDELLGVEDAFKTVNDIIGVETLNKLNFCDDI